MASLSPRELFEPYRMRYLFFRGLTLVKLMSHEIITSDLVQRSLNKVSNYVCENFNLESKASLRYYYNNSTRDIRILTLLI